MKIHEYLHSSIRRNKIHKHTFWILLLFAMIIRYTYYGFTYFPVTDDHSMYGLFNLLTVKDVLTSFKMYTTRPIAALLDACIISRLWNHAEIVLFFTILFHFFTCYLIYLVFEKNQLKIGVLASIVFALSPLGSEASYWIAASSRIVFGIFCLPFVLHFYEVLGKRYRTL